MNLIIGILEFFWKIGFSTVNGVHENFFRVPETVFL